MTLQTFADRKPAASSLARILHSPLPRHARTLKDLSARGAGVYFMVNGGDGKGRKATNVREVRALFVDLDGSPLEPVLSGPLLPHATVESSPGRFHAYWLVEGVELGEFESLQAAIAEKFDGDPKVKDLPRVMRLPGYHHRKGEPFLCRLLSLEDRPRITAEIARAAFGKPRGVTLAPTGKRLEAEIPQGQRNQRLFSLARSYAGKGYREPEVNRRLQKINAERCKPPLCATEIDAIAKQAAGYGSSGDTRIPNAVLDSQAWRDLSHYGRSIVVAAYRRLNAGNNGNISLPFSDFESEFARATFYRHRDAAVASGLLYVAKRARYSRQGGKEADLFGLSSIPITNGVHE